MKIRLPLKHLGPQQIGEKGNHKNIYRPTAASTEADDEGQALNQSGPYRCVLFDAVHLEDLISDLGKTTVELSKNSAMNRVSCKHLYKCQLLGPSL